MGDGWAALTWNAGSSCAVGLVDVERSRALAGLTLEGASRVGLRASGGSLIVFDDRGRAIAIDATTGEVELEWRIS